MANNPDGQRRPADYHEVYAKNYLYLFGTAIHKRFFLWWTGFTWLFTYVVTRFVGLDYMILHWHVENWWIFAPYTAIILGALAIWHHEVTRTARQREQEAAKRLAYAEEYINKNLPPPEDSGAPFREVNKKQ
jgi:hypothetical protein